MEKLKETDFGKRLKHAIERAGLNKRNVATLLGYTDVNTFYGILRGAGGISMDKILAIKTEILPDVNLNWLFIGEGVELEGDIPKAKKNNGDPPSRDEVINLLRRVLDLTDMTSKMKEELQELKQENERLKSFNS